MSTAERPPAADPEAVPPSPDAHRLAAFRDRARQLLQSQKARIRRVEAELSEEVATLFELVRHEKQAALTQQQTLHARIDSLANELHTAHSAQREGERLLGEARDGLAEALQQQAALRQQLSETNQLLDARTRQLEAAQQSCRDNSDAALSTEVTQLEAECERLREEVERLSTRKESGADEVDDLRQRFEMAVQEVRELKTRNEQLVSENSRSAGDVRAAGRSDPAPPANGFDWETQKQMLLQQLEKDFDEADAEQAEARLTIEGAIRITDQVVAEKEHEIAELKRLLDEQTGNIGDMAIGAAAVAQALDQDELIREERENLRQLQEDSRKKLRQAEVDVSVERAKIARERLELDEQMRRLASERESLLGHSEDSTRKSSPRGNWLARLGLKEDGPNE